MNLEQARFNMIEQQIRPWDVLDAHVLDLLAVVRREDFVPPAHRALAFADLEIPLKPGEEAIALGQVMLAPRVEARMLQDLQVAKPEPVPISSRWSRGCSASLRQMTSSLWSAASSRLLSGVAKMPAE